MQPSYHQGRSGGIGGPVRCQLGRWPNQTNRDLVARAITVPDRPDFSMIVGPDEAAQLLKRGVLADDDNDYVIHAMPDYSNSTTLPSPTP